MTLESLLRKHQSVPRNRKIAESFFYAGYIERWGTGTLRIAEVLKDAGLPSPQFESEAGSFKVVFYKQYLTKEHLQKIGLSERQLKAVAYAKAHNGITNAEYQSLVGVSRRTATRELNELKEKMILTVVGTGRGTSYKLITP